MTMTVLPGRELLLHAPRRRHGEAIASLFSRNGELVDGEGLPAITCGSSGSCTAAGAAAAAAAATASNNFLLGGAAGAGPPALTRAEGGDASMDDLPRRGGGVAGLGEAATPAGAADVERGIGGRGAASSTSEDGSANGGDGGGGGIEEGLARGNEKGRLVFETSASGSASLHRAHPPFTQALRCCT